MSEKTKIYYFKVDDCRYRGHVITYDVEYNDESFEIELEFPKKGFYMYVINEFSRWCIEDKLMFNNYKKC